MQYILIKFIRAYKLILSPMIGNACRFHPTCSSYGIESIEKHGSIYGSYLTIKRIFKCNPLFQGGIDNVPPVPTLKTSSIHTDKTQETLNRDN